MTTNDGGWSFADAWEAIADVQPTALATVHGARRGTWGELDARADAVARRLLDAGLTRHSKVAQHLHNCPEYLETLFACFKASLAPVNTNYRYTDDELVYLWDNSDAEAVVFHATYTGAIERIRDRVPKVSVWLHVADDSGAPCPSWAEPYDEVADRPTSRVQGPWGRSGDDLYILYTGGTTGMPKGVMWRCDDLFVLLDRPNRENLPERQDLDALRAKVLGRRGPTMVPCAPLMHGTGAFGAFSALSAGGCIVTLTSRSFDVVELLDTIEREQVKALAIVGDAFAKPILRALDSEPDRWDISSLRVITSSGVMWSAATKAGLLRHNSRLIMVDSLGSSEAIGMASRTSTAADDDSTTGAFAPAPGTRVVDDDGHDVLPGSGQRGKVAFPGRVPLGYYKDDVKTASTFVMIDGVRHSIPGDFAEVDADGTIRLLGRGSQCINTGGEKVYPEEVEEVLKQHPSVADVAVVGVPDERFGQAVCALVEPHDGHDVDEAALIAHVKTHLAAFKAPKRVLDVSTIGRAPNGKLDYKRLTAEASARTS